MLFFVLTICPYWGTGQNYVPKTDCENYNAFLDDEQAIEVLEEFTEKIYPTGLMKFNGTATHKISGFDDLTQYLSVCDGCTFELVDTKNGHFDSEKTIYTCQQYYNGIEVEDAGYIIADGGEDDPCGFSYLVPFIASDIDVPTKIVIEEKDLEAIIRTNQVAPIILNTIIKEQELVLSHNLKNDCGYNLTWKVEYVDEVTKLAWIDAFNGEFIKSVTVDNHLTAETEIYGEQIMDDSNSGGATVLAKADGSIIGYDFGGNIDLPNKDNYLDIYFKDTNIPTTTALFEWPIPLNQQRSVFQGFYSANLVASAFETELDLTFDVIHIGANCLKHNANSLPSISTMQEAYISCGRYPNSTSSYCVHDVIAHELSHVILSDYYNLGHSDIKPLSLQEGICDMFAVYIESIIQDGNIDWQIADDNTAGTPVRDLENPAYTLFSEVADEQENVHDRGAPLRQWFYTITNGLPDYGHSGLGLENAIALIMHALEGMPSSSDYHEMRDATLMSAEEIYGSCSDEVRLLISAWYAIGVLDEPHCDGDIVGPASICEENNQLILSIHNPVPDVQYFWFFPMTWTVQGANINSNMTEGNNLVVTGFPEYDYYSQSLQVRLYAPEIGIDSKRRYTIKLIDCDGDDPDCEDYYFSALQQSNSHTDPSSSFENVEHKINTNEVALVRAFTPSGRLIFEGPLLEFESNKRNLSNNQLIFLAYYDNSGVLLYSNKLFISK